MSGFNPIVLQFQNAVAHHARGQFAEALALYDGVIRLNPNIAQVHSNRGAVLAVLGRFDEALGSYDRAIKLKSDNSDDYYNRGIVLAKLGRLEDAIRNYDRAIKLNPDSMPAYYSKGLALQAFNRLEESIQSFDEAIRLKPDFADAHNNRANMLQELRRLDEALEGFNYTVRLRPDSAEAHYNKGNTLQLLDRQQEALSCFDQALALDPELPLAHNNRGNCLHALERSLEALPSYDCAIALDPTYAEAWNNKAKALNDIARPQEALACCEQALRLKPDLAEGYLNCGIALAALERNGEAMENFDRALALNPGLAEVHVNRGNLLKEDKQFDAALNSYDCAIALKPDYPEGKQNKGMCLLLLGRFAEGWTLYERRKEAVGHSLYPAYDKPLWLGQNDIAGKRLLLHGEQGLGDVIQFSRYALLARDIGAEVILSVYEQLVPLLKSLEPGVSVVASNEPLPEFDFYAPLLSMPLAVGTDLGSIPAKKSYLRADADRVQAWKSRIGEAGFKIGIAWQGNKQAKIDIGRSFTLRHFEGLSRLPGVRLISLQKGEGSEQLKDPGMKVETLEDLDTAGGAFLDSAAVMENLDLVITSDTALAHVAGALGRPTWVALRHVPDWRWMLERADSPWYPGMRLFRQPRWGDWVSVFAEMQAQLRSRL